MSQSAVETAGSPVADRAGRDRSFAVSVAWIGAVKWSGQILTWVSTLLVARFLSPGDYGLVGMATMYLGLVTLLSEFGLGMTIITLRDLTRRQIAELNTIAVMVGVLAFVLSCAVSVPLGWLFRAPELPVIVIVLSAGFVIGAFRTVPSGLLQRDLQFRVEALLEALQGVATAGSMVILAWRGFGHWTLVIGSLLGTILLTAGTLAVRRHPFHWPRLASVAGALTFTKHQLGGSFAWYIYSNADFFVAGRVLGKADLGVYSIAKTLALTFPEKVTGLIMRVTPAYFSAVQNAHGELRRYLLRLTELLSLLALPAMVGIVLVADQLVPLVLGEKWLAVVVPLKLLAIFAAYDSVSQLPVRALIATGDVRFLMRVGVVLAVLLPASFFVGSHWGLTGIAAGWLIIHPASQVAVLLRVRKQIGLSLREYAAALMPATQATALMTVSVLLAAHLLSASASVLLVFACKVGVGAVTYVLAVAALYPGKLADFRLWLASMRTAGAAAAPH